MMKEFPKSEVEPSRPIEDADKLEERRKAAGLEPFEDYRKSLIEKYKMPGKDEKSE